MKNLLKIILVFLFFIFVSSSSIAKSEVEISDDEQQNKKKSNSLSSLSTEDLEEMKRNQLLTYLDNQNYQSQEYAVFYFEQIGEKGVPPLLKYLRNNEDDEKIASSVIYTLGRVGKKAKKAVPTLMKYLEHPNQDIVKTTMAALGKIGKASEPAVPQIAKHLEDKNEWTRTLALRSLKDIGTQQSLAIAGQYEKKLLLEQERKNRELLGKSGKPTSNPSIK
jgi:HEAT repeat protein